MANSELEFFERLILDNGNFTIEQNKNIDQQRKLTKEEKRLRKLHRLYESGELIFE